MKFFNKKFLNYLLIILIFSIALPIFSEKKKKKKQEDDEDDPLIGSRIEAGFRAGLGRRPSDRFENQLNNFKDTTSAYAYSFNQLSPLNATTNAEVFLRIRWSDNWMGGLFVGESYLNKFHMTEVDTAQSITRYNFQIRTQYFFLMAHYEWRYKSFFLEAGGGMGVNTITWMTNGITVNPAGVYNINGFMTGNGLGYRLESSVGKRIDSSFSLSFGLAVNYFTVPYFSGNLNNEGSSVYIKSDNSIGLISDSNIGKTINSTTFASRRLDMTFTNYLFFIGTSYRF